MQSRLRMLACTTALAVTAAFGSSGAWAQDAAAAPPPPPPVELQPTDGLDRIFGEATELNRLAQNSQERIDATAGETGRLLREYQGVLREIESLKAYNAQQRRVVADQEKQLAELQQSIDDVVTIRREITPLMLRMIESLEDFVRLDVPFLAAEREERIENLRTFMDASDISPSEKFRLVLEAYQIENEYGRTIAAYPGEVEIDGQNRQVDFLRIGRVLLAYRTQDGERIGRWNQRERRWDELGSEFEGSIQAALRFANKQAAPDMYLLPIPGPVAAQE